ncbi:MAG: helix-turn-helix transcriptional regulator [Chloroflexi bacterium]|nr:helix-turn-helix transcriptional regulator [Chloroflexota bacterium]
MPHPGIDLVVAANIRAALEQDGRTAYAVSIGLGHGGNWLNRIVNGRKGISYVGLREVAAELGVTAGSLVDGTPRE